MPPAKLHRRRAHAAGHPYGSEPRWKGEFGRVEMDTVIA